MTTKQIASNFSVSTTDTIETVFTASQGNAVMIESFTASNTSSVNASYSAYIQASNGELQPQIPFKVVVWGENDLGIGVVNQVIPTGGMLMVESSSLDSIYFTITGRDIVN